MKSGSATPDQVLGTVCIGTVCIGIVLANLDLFTVNVALPDIAHSFPAASLEDLSWILNGYAIAYAALLVWAFLLSVVPDVRAVVAGMALMGIGAGLTIPTLMGTGLGALPPSSFATASGVVNMVRQALMAVGVAALVAVLGQPEAGTAGMETSRAAWWMLAVPTLAGLVPTLLHLRTWTARRPVAAAS